MNFYDDDYLTDDEKGCIENQHRCEEDPLYYDFNPNPHPGESEERYKSRMQDAGWDTE